MDYKDHCGNTPFLLAVQDGQFKIAEYLIKYGSDVNEVDDHDQSALYFILSGNKKCARIIKTLFDSGYIINEIDNSLLLGDQKKQINVARKYLKLIKKLQTVNYGNDDEYFDW